MPMNRRTLLGSLLGLGVAGTAGTGASLLGAAPAYALDGAPARTASPRQAPTQEFAVGVREFHWNRGDRQLFTKVFYPAAGSPGGVPIPDAPLADGVFPVCEWSHGLGGNSDSYGSQTHAAASAGFVVPAPTFPASSPQEVYNGNQSRDVSEVITRTLALNDTSGGPFAGRIDTAAGVGVAGHSLGGMTTHGLLTAWPDDRIVAAVPVACVDMGDPAGQVDANVLFIHGDRDGTCPYSSARQAYEELRAPKAFLTHLGADHGSYLVPDFPTFSQTQNTFLDWLRWSLYGDTAARDRLAGDASAPGTSWEAALAARTHRTSGKHN
ncbi:alpha/beta hydrolase [Streptomyces oryzae]|uniref:Alpha/beta hydrolase n=1 Tax=Streptomyces oryzae TaxID=1434886 RepID=A0ABS3XEQ6_9ACTN|nr:alpha/beta hydrolase [Streptomyces oryzae]MBO8193877.1 alpha/beta hydrolase [Streptomyces oryzae]